MSQPIPLPAAGGFGSTSRRDAWWLQPVTVAVGFGFFVIYSTWAAFQGNNYLSEPYLSPFYSPLILLKSFRFSPAFLILWAPLGFRATCYYYRKAYYRAYFLDPPACAVGELGAHRYKGETIFPFILQNFHRFFMYCAVALVIFLWSDAIRAFRFNGHFGIGVGTIVLVLNSTFLSCYTFSCHSVRHLVGGGIDAITTSRFGKIRYRLWTLVSNINPHHMLWAWTSLFMVGFSDFYVRMVASGVWTDFRIF